MSTSLLISLIREAIASALLMDLEISSDLAIILYIDLMFESIVSVSFVTEFLYTSTLSAEIELMLWSKLARFSVKLSMFAARYWASISKSFRTFESSWGGNDDENCFGNLPNGWLDATGDETLILYSKSLATKCFIPGWFSSAITKSWKKVV